jgi:hypothetical protein
MAGPGWRTEGTDMPKGPRGEKRPADVIGGAIMVARIATGEIEERLTPESPKAKGGKVGGKARAAKLSAEERRAIAQKAAEKRWKR